MALFSSVPFPYPALGISPKGDHLKEIQKSPQYDREQKKFVNRKRDLLIKMYERNRFGKMLIYLSLKGRNVRPQEKLPESKPNLSAFLSPSSSLKFIWFGHSSFVVNMNGKILLFDPVFSESASPVSFLSRRFQAPVIPLEELSEKIDFIVISHDHYDHLDMKTVKSFQDKQAKFIVPLGLPSHLISWGISRERIQELDWWQSVKMDELELICTPAQHFSGRRSVYCNDTLWASWVVKNNKHSLYFSGDSGYDTHFKEIGLKYGPFDLAFIENGQYDEMWRSVHMMPQDSAQAFLDLGAKEYVPVHWSMFSLSVHSWYDPIEAIEQLAQEKGFRLLTPKLGQLVEAGGQTVFEKWWKTVI